MKKIHSQIMKLKRLFMLSTLAFFTVVIGFNCSKKGFEVNTEVGNFSSLSSDKVSLPIGLLTSEQILKSMVAVTGVEHADDQLDNTDNVIMETYNERLGSLPAVQGVDNINGPLLVSVTNIGAGVCRKMVNKEKIMNAQDRLYFKEIDFAQGLGQFNSSILNPITNRMARSFWSRELKEQERSIINAIMLSDYISGDNKTGVTLTNADKTELFALSLCTAMISSFDMLVY